MNGLNNGQAVQLGEDLFMGRLETGSYRINGNDVFTVTYGGKEVSYTSSDTIQRMIPGKKYKTHYEDSNCNKLTLEDYDTIYHNNRTAFMDEDGDIIYPDLETEFKCRSQLEWLEQYKPYYEKDPDQWEEYKFNVIGHNVDTGSRFIETPFSAGSVVWKHQKGAFRVHTGVIAKNEVLRLQNEYKDYKFDIPTHSNIEYVKFEGEYVFTRSDKGYVKRPEVCAYHTNLEDAKKEEASVRKYVRDKIFLVMSRKFPKTVDKATAQLLLGSLHDISNNVSCISPKQKSYSSWAKANGQLSETIKMLEDVILKDF